MGNLDGRTAIVTGAAGGIGYAVAKKFLEEGASVVICDVDKLKIEAAQKSLENKGNIMAVVLDITDREGAKNLMDQVAKCNGRIDILANIAGITKDAQFYKMDLDDFTKVIDINLIGTVNMIKSAVPYMMEQKYGRIINTSSVAALAGNFGQTNYTASKGAILAMSHSLGRELAKYGITVNTVIPGSILTPMTMAIPENIRAEKASKFPMRRWGEPEEIANAYAFLASDEASFINTAELKVDGGYF